MDAVGRMAHELAAKFPNQPARSLAKVLVRQTKNALTLEQARSRIRYALGINGKQHRKWATTPRKPRQAGAIIEMPKSQAVEWAPYKLGVTGKIGILSDIHVPYHSDLALAAAVKHLQQANIDCLLLNGDFADFYSISRWEKNPAQRNLSNELKQVRQLLEWLRETFPQIPIVAKLGNHEERWESWLFAHAPEISDQPEMSLETWLRFDKLGIEIVRDKRLILAGELPIGHGHELPKGMMNPVNMARGAFLRTIHSILVGHGHRTSGHAETDLWHNEIFCWSTGCLCDLTPDYSRLNKWNWGFAMVEVFSDQSFSVDNYRIGKNGTVRGS